MRRRPPVWIAKHPYKEGSADNQEQPSSTGCTGGLGQEQDIQEISGCVTLMCKLLGKGWQDDWVTPGRLAAAPNGLLFNRSPCPALLSQKSPNTSPSGTESLLWRYTSSCEPGHALPWHWVTARAGERLAAAGAGWVFMKNSFSPRLSFCTWTLSTLPTLTQLSPTRPR